MKCASTFAVILHLSPVAPLAQRHIEPTGMADRITVTSGDFFEPTGLRL